MSRHREGWQRLWGVLCVPSCQRLCGAVRVEEEEEEERGGALEDAETGGRTPQGERGRFGGSGELLGGDFGWHLGGCWHRTVVARGGQGGTLWPALLREGLGVSPGLFPHVGGTRVFWLDRKWWC